MVKQVIKKALKTSLTAVAPLFGKKSTLTVEAARETLAACSPRPAGTAAAQNRIVEPTCDLQIIIPAYNVEDYLEDCMDSVLAQQTKYSFHVILVDDGAKDRTPEIADKYAGDPRVTVIHQQNKGLSGARNTGLTEIFGKYLMFVDSDDILCEGAIEAMLDTAFERDCEIVEGSAYYLIEDRRTVMHRYEGVVTLPSAFALHGHAWGKVYRSSLFENLCFPEGYWYEDSILAHLIFPVVKKVCGCPAMAYGYRINQAGIVKSSKGKPRAIETYWITEQMIAERQRLGLPNDKAYFDQLLDQIMLNQFRVKQLPLEIQESMFVLTCDLLEKTFPKMEGGGNLAKALRTRDFGAYKLCCKLY